MGSEEENVFRLMKPLLQKARDNNCVLRSRYQGIYFTPDELEAAWKDGRFVWGPVNWDLVSCDEARRRHRLEVEEAQRNLDSFSDRVDGPYGSVRGPYQ